MPVTVTRLEPGIYRYQWLGLTRLEETREALQGAVEQGKQHGDNPHVQIIDLSEVRRYPVDLRGLGEISEMQREYVRCVLVVAASPGAKLLGRTLTRIVPALRNMQFHETLDQAVVAAREIIGEDASRGINLDQIPLDVTPTDGDGA
jgi:hypothetical protein